MGRGDDLWLWHCFFLFCFGLLIHACTCTWNWNWDWPEQAWTALNWNWNYGAHLLIILDTAPGLDRWLSPNPDVSSINTLRPSLNFLANSSELYPTKTENLEKSLDRAEDRNISHLLRFLKIPTFYGENTGERSCRHSPSGESLSPKNLYKNWIRGRYLTIRKPRRVTLTIHNQNSTDE